MKLNISSLDSIILNLLLLTFSTIHLIKRENNSQYNKEKNTFYLDYKFALSGVDYHAVDTLVLRQSPEMDLRFEEW